MDFYAAKAVVEAIARDLGMPPLAWARSEHPALHPGRAAVARVGDILLGAVGQLHPEAAAAVDLRQAAFVFELDAQALMEPEAGDRRYQPPSRFPTLTRDLAVVVPQGTAAAGVREIIERVAGELARAIELFDVYAGLPLPEDRVSLAFTLKLAATDRTLTDAEADQLLARLRAALTRECQAEFR